MSTEYGYNAGSLLTSLVSRAPGGSVQKQYGYTYLLDGNRATETEGNKLREYAYDKAGQLTQERVTENGVEKLKYNYEYDGTNRRSVGKYVEGAFATWDVYTCDKANRIVQCLLFTEDGLKPRNYIYDANGSLTRQALYNASLEKDEHFTYDVLGRQTGYTDGTVTAAYSYDADGLRTSKTVNGVTTEYVTDGGRVVLELVNGTPTARYLYGLGLVHATIGADKYYYSYNGHGDVVQLTNASGNVVRSYEYDAFGNELNPTAGDNNPFRYCGEYFDAETGSYYLRARYYNPQSGRFLTEDPIRDGLNWYTYCANNPVMWVDPSGLVICAADSR